MNTPKSIAIVAAMLITVVGMTGIARYSNAAATAIQQAHNVSVEAQPITTLPAIEVKPTVEQLRELRKGGTSGAVTRGQMPYYSFAADAVGA